MENRHRSERYKLEHRCVSCGHALPIDRKQTHCEFCIHKRVQQVQARRQRLKELGLCCYCGAPATLRNRDPMCETCWFKAIAQKGTGRRSDWSALKHLLEHQGFSCAYTGKILIIGVNAALDHIIPISRGGRKSLENVHWIDLKVNAIKQNLTHDEFLDIARSIVSYNTPIRLGGL